MQDKTAHSSTDKSSSFRTLVGYRAIAWRENYAEIELDLGPEHLNSLGIVHGGVPMTLLDAAMGHAAIWCSVRGNVRRCVTVSLTTHFLVPARSGIIRAIGRLVAIENRIGTCLGEVVDDNGRLIATGQSSFLYFPGSERVEGVARA